MRGPGGLLWAWVPLAGFACEAKKDVASRYVKTVPVTATVGATITVSVPESRDLARTELVIPPGSLARDTTITLELGTKPITTIDSEPAGPVAIWGPPGTVFRVPATLTLPVDPKKPIDGLVVEVREEEGRRSTIPEHQVTADSAAFLVRFSVSGFTWFQPARRAPCIDDFGCPSGRRCDNRRCVAVSDAGVDGNASRCANDTACPSGSRCSSGGACQPCQPGSCLRGDAGPTANVQDGGSTGAQACQVGGGADTCPVGTRCVQGRCVQ